MKRDDEQGRGQLMCVLAEVHYGGVGLFTSALAIAQFPINYHIKSISWFSDYEGVLYLYIDCSPRIFGHRQLNLHRYLPKQKLSIFSGLVCCHCTG